MAISSALIDRDEILEPREERVAERTADLESFSSSVSHDLRAPLRAIHGFSGILLEDYGDSIDAECLRLLGVIRRSSENMEHLIDDLLAFSRLGLQRMSRSEVDMGELVRSVFAELAASAPERRVELEVKELPATSGDRAMLHQVWHNLISNAIKFTKTKEQAAIEVGCTPGNAEDTYYIRDNGVGFEMQYVDKLFGVFQRLHVAEDFEGTGVGLAIVQRVVQRHGGRVWARGAVDEGATIFVALPKEG